ncbi:MAG: hypothetical protein WD471_00755 [Candidatus Paceibacterota bacterium]
MSDDAELDLMSSCKKYGELQKQEEVLRITLRGNLRKEEREEASRQLMDVKLEMNQALQAINGNGRHPYLSHRC